MLGLWLGLWLGLGIQKPFSTRNTFGGCRIASSAYNQIGNIGYQHGTVNGHTYNFMDRQTGVHTNRVEAMWMRAKKKFKAHHGATNRHMIPDYMAEFMWIQ